jgi:hypothetical protein
MCYSSKNVVFWDVAPCRSCEPKFRSNVSPPSSGQKNPQARNQRYVPPKRRFTQDLHGTTSQKTAFFVVTAVKTTNLTRYSLLCVTMYLIEDVVTKAAFKAL